NWLRFVEPGPAELASFRRRAHAGFVRGGCPTPRVSTHVLQGPIGFVRRGALGSFGEYVPQYSWPPTLPETRKVPLGSFGAAATVGDWVRFAPGAGFVRRDGLAEWTGGRGQSAACPGIEALDPGARRLCPGHPKPIFDPLTPVPHRVRFV